TLRGSGRAAAGGPRERIGRQAGQLEQVPQPDLELGLQRHPALEHTVERAACAHGGVGGGGGVGPRAQGSAAGRRKLLHGRGPRRPPPVAPPAAPPPPAGSGASAAWRSCSATAKCTHPSSPSESRL